MRRITSAMWQCLLVIIVAGSLACGRERPGATQSMQVTVMPECRSSQLGDEFVARMTPAFVDSLDVYMASVDVLGDVVAFTTSRDDRVVITDRGFTTQRFVLDQRGGGPGDISRPLSVNQTENGFAVFEAGNQRVSFWTPTGDYVKSVRVGSSSGSFAIDEQNRIYSTSNASKHYVLETSEGMQARQLGTRLRSPSVSNAPTYVLDEVTRTPDGTLFVYDNANQLIVRVPHDESPQRMYALPASVQQAVAAEIEESERSFEKMGMQGIAAALRTFRATDDGRLFIRTVLDKPFAMLVDPADMSCTALTLPRDASARAVVQQAYSMTVADSTLFVASPIGKVVEFALPQ